MTAISHLPQRLQHKIEAELQAGESITWAGRPALGWITKKWLFLSTLIVMPFALYLLVPWLLTLSRFGYSDSLFPLGISTVEVFCLLFGVLFLFGRFFAAVKAASTVYAITDRRAIAIEGVRATVKSYRASDMAYIAHEEHRDGSGNLTLGTEQVADGKGGTYDRQCGFMEIDDVRSVRKLIETLIGAAGGQRQANDDVPGATIPVCDPVDKDIGDRGAANDAVADPGSGTISESPPFALLAEPGAFNPDRIDTSVVNQGGKHDGCLAQREISWAEVFAFRLRRFNTVWAVAGLMVVAAIIHSQFTEPAGNSQQQVRQRDIAPTVAAVAPAAVQTCGDAWTLLDAIRAGCTARLRKLIERDPPQIEVRDARGQTPLAVAVLDGRHAAAKILLQAGADVNAPVRRAKGAWPDVGGLELAQYPERADGSTPLILARDVAMATLLLQARAETHKKNAYGWSAVFYYTRHGSLEMLKALLDAGARIDDTADVDPSHAGSTPLMWAAYMNRPSHLETLLAYKPRLDIRDRAGKTALDYARQFGHANAIRLLADANAIR